MLPKNAHIPEEVIMNPIELEKTIAAASQGDKDSLERLTIEASPRIKAFLFRTTLNEELAEDLAQETLMQMVVSIKTLKKTSGFWSWIYRIAINKAREHYRRVKRLNESSLEGLEENIGLQLEGGIDAGLFPTASRKEVSAIIAESIAKLKSKYRAVLSMRCYDDMAYKHIADSLNCSELAARVMFVRAKQLLKKELCRRGIEKASLLAVIVLFGRSTVRPALAAEVSVVTSALETSPAAAVIASLTTPKAAGVAVGAVLVAAGLAALSGGEDTVLLRDGVNSVHYVIHAVNEQSRWGSLRSGAYEKWCYFPDGVDGPMILRMQRWDSKMQTQLCSWLQDEHANYYYHSGNNTVTILNERLGGFLEMPTDPPQMAAFVDRQLPEMSSKVREWDPVSQLLAKCVNNPVEEAQAFETLYTYNAVDPVFFAPYWPPECVVHDIRTPMHKRGWTVFNITGRYGDEQITGQGQVPFVLSAVQKNPAWMIIRIGERFSLVDNGDKAWIADDNGRPIAGYPPGSFLMGFSRPWMGYDALDTVRRDAAKTNIPFETYFNEGRTWAQVVLDFTEADVHIGVVYEIDLMEDLVKSISINSYGAFGVGEIELTFEYFQQIDTVVQNYIMPTTPDDVKKTSDSLPSPHWLVALGSGKLLFQGPFKQGVSP